MSVESRQTRSVTYTIEVAIAAPRIRVWQALTEEIDAWWLPDYHEMGEGSVVMSEVWNHLNS